MCLIVSNVLVFYNYSGLGQKAFLFMLAKEAGIQKVKKK